MTSKQMLSLINKRNFMINSRRDNEAVLYARRGGVPLCGISRSETTKKLNKISLPFGNLDFAQSLRYFASLYMNKASAKSLDLSQNQDFNLGEVFI